MVARRGGDRDGDGGLALGLPPVGVVVLLLGGRYGDRLPSGISATHEEYREAKSRCPVLAFVPRDVDREAAQQDFVDAVRSWAGGVLTGDFASPEELHDAATRAMHELELAQQAGPFPRAGTPSTSVWRSGWDDTTVGSPEHEFREPAPTSQRPNVRPLTRVASMARNRSAASLNPQARRGRARTFARSAGSVISEATPRTSTLHPQLPAGS